MFGQQVTYEDKGRPYKVKKETYEEEGRRYKDNKGPIIFIRHI